MLFRTPSFAGIGFAVLACLVMTAPDSEAQLKFENFFPHQVPHGQTTVLHAIINSINEIQSAEITPVLASRSRGSHGVNPGTPTASCRPRWIR